MNLAVVNAAERDHEFITHPPAQRSWLHKTEVVGIGMLSPTHKTRLLSNKPQMLFVAMASRLCNRNNALVDTDQDAIFRADRGICCHRCRLGELGGWRSAGTVGLQFGQPGRKRFLDALGIAGR